MFSAAALSSVAGRRWDEKHDRDGHFLCEPKDAACDPRLGKVDRQILTLLCRYANSAGRCSPSVAKLAREGGKDRSQVQRAIARLVAFGYVLRAERRKTRDRNQTNIYCVIYNSSLRRALILEARQAAEARRVQQKPARRAAALLGLARKRLHSAWESSPPPREKEPVAGDPKRGWAAVSAAENKTRVLINDSQSAVAATSDSSTDHGCVDCEAAAGNTDQEEARRDEYAPSCEPGSSTAKLVGRSAAQLERQNPRGIRKRRDGVSSPTPLSIVNGPVHALTVATGMNRCEASIVVRRHLDRLRAIGCSGHMARYVLATEIWRARGRHLRPSVFLEAIKQAIDGAIQAGLDGVQAVYQASSTIVRCAGADALAGTSSHAPETVE